MIVGVALGVAVVVAIDITNQSAQRAFELSTEALAGRTTHHVVGGPSGLDESIYTSLRLAAVRSIAPVVAGWATAPAHPGRTFQLLGVDAFAEGGLRPSLGDALVRSGADGGSALGELMTRPNSVLLSRTTAEAIGIARGDTLELVIGGTSARVTVLGFLDPDDNLTRTALLDVLLGDISTVQELLALDGRLSRIDVRADDDDGVLERIRSFLPPGASLVDASLQRDTIFQMTQAFRLNLEALSLLALVVSMFLIYNTMTFSVIQRRSLFGLLRALGATRQQLFAAILLESWLVGVVGTLLGLGVGAALSSQLIDLVTQTINDLYFVLAVRSVFLAPATLLEGVLLGVGATMIAALLPAFEATRSPPRTTLSRVALESRTTAGAPRLALAGTILIIAATMLLLASRAIFWSFVGLFGVITGFALLAPLATVIASRAAVRPLTALLGVVGRMAAHSLSRNLSRTGVAIAALTIAVSVVVGVGVMIQSFRFTVESWLETTLQADIYIAPPTRAGTRVQATLERGLVDRLIALDGVADWGSIRSVEVASSVGPVGLSVFETGRYTRDALSFQSGTPHEAWTAFESTPSVLITEPLAFRHQLAVGDHLTLTSDHGSLSLGIVGVVFDYASDQGTVYISRATYERSFDDRAISGVSLVAGPGVDLDQLLGRVRASLGLDDAVIVQSNRELRDASLEVFDRTFEITAVLRLLATGVAFIGVLSALLALAIERNRELAMLRAIGLEPAQVWKLVLGQTALIGVISGLLAIVVGLAQAVIMIEIINKRSFGWSLEMHVDPALLTQALVIAVVAALIAGVIPARRMATVSLAEAMRNE